MNRREYLKGSAILVAGAAISGCDKEDSAKSASASENQQFTGERETAEYGTGAIDTSGWTKPEGVAEGYPALDKDLDADVVVVGAGLAGGSLALHLAEQGVNVVVLESRQPGWGGSGRNAGHVLPVLKDLEVFEQFPDGGKKFIELFKEHQALTFELAKKHEIDCDAVKNGYLDAMQFKRSFNHYKETKSQWEKEQGQAIELLGAAEMKKLTGSDYYPRGVLHLAGGTLNPYLFTVGLVSAAVKQGASVYGDSEVDALTQSDKRWRVGTPTGSVTCDRVVFCTNAYPTNIIPEFTNSYYPLVAYCLATKPLPKQAADIILPGRVPFVQVPVGLNPVMVDRHDRLITASIPSSSKPEDAMWHFKKHLGWIHRTWPETKELPIELEDYWTGMVALRDREFPGVFEMQPGVYGLMHFNAWGNVMAPLMGKLFADGLAKDSMDQLPFPLEKPEPVSNPGKQELIIRKILIPAGTLGQKMGIV